MAKGTGNPKDQIKFDPNYVAAKPLKDEMPVKPKPIKEMPMKDIGKDFGKVLSQQPITMGEGYKNEINQIRPIGNGSAMRNQYRAQGGGRFK